MVDKLRRWLLSLPFWGFFSMATAPNPDEPGLLVPLRCPTCIYWTRMDIERVKRAGYNHELGWGECHYAPPHGINTSMSRQDFWCRNHPDFTPPKQKEPEG